MELPYHSPQRSDTLFTALLPWWASRCATLKGRFLVHSRRPSAALQTSITHRLIMAAGDL